MKTFLICLILSSHILGMNLVKFDHLEKLSEWFNLKDSLVKGYWIYSERFDSDYKPVGAINEGDFCVDDVARAVLVYTEAYRLTKNHEYLNLAKDASSFLIQMQAEDGEFYNFAYRDGTINMHGPTSYKSTSWWTLRAFWALAALAVETGDEQIFEAARKSHQAISRKPPIFADQLSIYILGLCEYNKIRNVKDEIKRYVELLLKFLIVEDDPTFRRFFSTQREEFRWNGWGNRYAEALIESYKVLGEEKLLNIAIESIELQIPLLSSSGFIYKLGKYVKLTPELSYAVEPLVVAAAKAYELTKDENMAFLSALAAAWYFGANRLGERMYGPNGEGYDGLEYMHVNKNAGAESTICAIRSMIYLGSLPIFFQKLATSMEGFVQNGMLVLEAETADPGISPVSLVTGDYGANVAFKFESRTRLKWSGVPEGKYYVYVAGEFGKNRCTVSSGSGSISKTLDGNGVFFVGQIETVSSLRLSLEGSGIVDQVILVPVVFGVSFEVEDQAWTVVYSVEETKKLKIVPGRYFERQIAKRERIFNVQLEKTGRFLLVQLEGMFNNDGIATPEMPGNFDNLGGAVGAYLPVEELSEGVKVINGISFLLKPIGLDNFRVSDQKLILPEAVKVKSVHLLAASNHGDYELTLMCDGDKFSVLVSDWCRGQKDLVLDFRYTASGQKEFIKCGLDVHSFELSRSIKEIVLSGSMNIHIFAITLELEDG
ncbi:MAG: hypothetical protein PWQ90_158 [Pseudothermotoga sp.]|nr:hypothetical protein [Pseudothermotoga sp.]